MTISPEHLEGRLSLPSEPNQSSEEEGISEDFLLQEMERFRKTVPEGELGLYLIDPGRFREWASHIRCYSRKECLAIIAQANYSPYEIAAHLLYKWPRDDFSEIRRWEANKAMHRTGYPYEPHHRTYLNMLQELAGAILYTGLCIEYYGGGKSRHDSPEEKVRIK